jgi:lysylphosphatidylglycerol synthetase-like protein (DUF2156 family)
MRQRLVKRFGTQGSVYFNFQADVKHVGKPELGFISYFEQKFLRSTYNIVFTNPVCAPANSRPLLELFLESSKRKTMFFGIDHHTAETLAELGYKTNHIGPEYWLPVQEFKVEGKGKKHLRWAKNLGERGFTVKEQPWSDVSGDEVRSISNQWRRKKAIKHRELRLLTRPPEFKDEWRVRKFYCYKDGVLVGYVFFDPHFENGETIGYCANILRGNPEIKPNGFLDFTILEAMKVFKKEGVRYLSLGFSPLHDLRKTPHEIPAIRTIANLFYTYGSKVYSFQTLAFHKNRYRPEQTEMYVAVKGISVPSVVALTINSLNVF